MRNWHAILPESIKSLRFQALLWMVLSLLLLLVISIGLTFFAYERVAESLAQSRNQELAIISADRVSDNMLTFTRILLSIATQADMRGGEADKQRAVFSRFESLLTDFDGGVLLLDKDGIVIDAKSMPANIKRMNYSDDPSFLSVRALETYSFSDIIREDDTNDQLIIMAVPILSDQNEFAGALIGRFYLRLYRLGEEIRKLKVGENGIAYLVDRNGRAIYHPDHSLVGADLRDQEAVIRLMHGERKGAFIATLEDKNRWVVGYAAVEATGWGLVTREAWDEVIAPTRDLLKTIALILVVSTVIISAIVSLAVQRVTGPIANLVLQTRQVATGDYSARVELSPILEIRELGIEFNAMVDEISRYRTGMRQYVAAITQSQEEERKRIARDLHDDTVQSLIAIGRQIEIIRGILDDPQTAKVQLSHLRRMITETIESVRQFSRDLRPLTLEDLGLVPALQNLLNRLEQETSIEAQFQMEGRSEGLAGDVEVAIYRVVQETINNVRKHANASRVQLKIEFLQNQIIVTVIDNGIGFEVPERTTELARSGNYGLMGLQERAQLFGGQLFIKSASGKGTSIKLVVPKQISSALISDIAKQRRV